LFRFDIEYLDTALKYLRKVINLRGQRPSTSRSKPNREELPRTILSDHEEARAQAQAADLAHLASTEPSVLDFRRNILGFIPRGQADGACGRLLNDVEAAAFVSSPIARSLERWEYERLGLSYIGPNAAVGEEHFERDESFSIRYRVTIGEKIIRSWVVSAHDPPPTAYGTRP